MEISKAIAALQAAGFHLYRRLRNGRELIGAMMVHTTTDLYVGLRLLDDGLCSYLSGECVAWDGGLFVNFDELRAKLPGLLAQAQAQRDELTDHLGQRGDELDMRLSARLHELKKRTGRTLAPCWRGENGCMKGVYRGVVLEINDVLRVVAFDDYVLQISDSKQQGGIPLEDVFDQIDAAGGHEEECIEDAPGLEDESRAEVLAVH